MAQRRSGRWNNRPGLGQIEELAVRKVAEFRRTLQAAGLSVPEIPPVSAEYLALTITELSVRGVLKLSHAGKRLSGMLDMEQAEILYEENDPSGRQNFSIAHELGHYFLHYLPALELAHQPTLFDQSFLYTESKIEVDEKLTRPARFFRCNELESAIEAESSTIGPAKIGRQALEDPGRQVHMAKIIRLRELEDRIEWEANIFARGLLMPSDLVRWLNKKHAGEVTPMAAELGVTPMALRYRLNGLKLRQDEDKGLGSGYKVTSKDYPTHQQGSFF